MKYIYFFLGIIMLSFSCTSCDPTGANVCTRDYSFTVPVKITPIRDTFHLGDTLQISMNFPKNMIDNSSDSFDLSAFPFNATIDLLKIDEAPFSDGPGMASYKAITGGINVVYFSATASEEVQIVFDKATNLFLFSCNVILEKKGVFDLSYQSADFFDEFNEFDFKNECRTNSVKIFYDLEADSTKTNFELLGQSPDSQIVAITREKFDKSGGFAFVVVD